MLLSAVCRNKQNQHVCTCCTVTCQQMQASDSNTDLSAMLIDEPFEFLLHHEQRYIALYACPKGLHHPKFCVALSPNTVLSQTYKNSLYSISATCIQPDQSMTTPMHMMHTFLIAEPG